MVTRTHKEVNINYTPPSSNPGYGWLRKLADAIIEACGAEQQSAATGNITLTIPDFPGVLYLSASSSSSSVTVALRKSGSSSNLMYSLSVTCANNMTVCYEAVGDFLHLLRFNRERSTDITYVAWAWFVGQYTGETYYYLYSRGGEVLPSLFPYLSYQTGSSNTYYCSLFSADLNERYNFALSGNNSTQSADPYQPWTSYPQSTDAKILMPYAATCGIYTDGIPNPGYCKWGGEYMLYVLCSNSSYTPATVEPGVNYRVNGKNYLACGSTLIIPEPWPFIEEA